MSKLDARTKAKVRDRCGLDSMDGLFRTRTREVRPKCQLISLVQQ